MIAHWAFGVIPSILVGGPLAILAMLFPTMFGGLMLWLRRWFAMSCVLCFNSLFCLINIWLRLSISSYGWWDSQLILWETLTSITLLGVIWSWRRSQTGKGYPIGVKPGVGELVILWMLVLAGLGAGVYCAIDHKSLFASDKQLLLVIWTGAGISLLYLFFLRVSNRLLLFRPFLSIESVMLGGMGLACVAIAVITWIEAGNAIHIIWTFVPSGEGWIVSSPVVVDDRVYTAVAQYNRHSTQGVVYCLDRHTGKRLWVFDDDGGMKQVFSSPAVVEGRLYIGEGFHQDSRCKVYCVDVATGKKLWDFRTNGHTESSPCVVGRRVYIGAGGDGLYCLDGLTGAELWHFQGPHVDAKPAVERGRVYAGSGYDTYEVFCLDASTGKLVWRLPVELPSFGSPTVNGERVFFGIGNGNLLQSSAIPAGALLCVNTENGKELWRYQVPDGVHARPVVRGRDLYFTSRDYNCYCLDEEDGVLRWKQNLGSSIVTAPILAPGLHDGEKDSLYVAASDGMVWCLDAEAGFMKWSFDVSGHAQGDVLLVSAPAVVSDQVNQNRCRQLYFGAKITLFGATPALFCLEER
jgi:outer membrane protein assembly factor BamB